MFKIMKPALMALDMKMFVIRAKESIQSLANFLAKYVEDFPDFVEILERIKILVGDVIIIPEVSQVPRLDLGPENEVLALIEGQKWANIAMKYYDCDILKLYEFTDLTMILCRLFTEETDDEDQPFDIEGPIKIINEIWLKREKRLLPIDLLILGKFEIRNSKCKQRIADNF